MISGFRLPPFRLVHAAYVTRDLDRGKRWLATMFGVEECVLYPNIGVGVPGGTAQIGFVAAKVQGMSLEVIRPQGGEDHVYRQMLPDDPDEVRLHHFASLVENEAEWNQVLQAASEHDLEIVVDGGGEYGSRYVYLDTRRQLGHMLEYIWQWNKDAKGPPDLEMRHERLV